MKIKVAGIEIVIYKIDLNLIRNYHWHLHGNRLDAWIDGKHQYLHHLIAKRMGLDPNKRIYRKNKNRLDFRRSNLIDFPPSQRLIRKNALIDEWNMDLIRGYSWYLTKGYLQGWIDGKTQYLHIIVAKRMGLDPSKQVDHIDRSPLNNHESNLREATISQNRVNSKIRSDNTSGYIGVSWHKKTKKWQASICFKGKRIYLGLFNDKKDAACAYDKTALKHFGEFARLNFT